MKSIPRRRENLINVFCWGISLFIFTTLCVEVDKSKAEGKQRSEEEDEGIEY
jgi:hypothetical protein